jgi:hypothetical protein
MRKPTVAVGDATMVYVLQDTEHDVSKAMDFGSLTLVLDRYDEAQMLNMPRIVAKMRSRLAKFTPMDYLLLVGNPVTIGVACAIVADLCGGRFTVLKWDGQERRYYPIRVDINIDPYRETV